MTPAMIRMYLEDDAKEGCESGAGWQAASPETFAQLQRKWAVLNLEHAIESGAVASMGPFATAAGRVVVRPESWARDFLDRLRVADAWTESERKDLDEFWTLLARKG